MTWFDGKLEQKSQSMKDYQGARLRRLQEVRLQEKLMSLSRCDEYRKFIRFRKKKKTEVVKEGLINEKRDRHDELAFARQSSLVDTGFAHRNACEISSNAVINNIRQKLLVNKARASAFERGRIATIEGNDKLLVRQNLAAHQISMINLRQSAIASDREDARRTAEARATKFPRESAVENLRSSESAFSRKLLSMKKLTQQGSNRVQDRGTVFTEVNILRYDRSDENNRLFLNNSAAEERSALIRRWTAVMKEMVHRKCSASRARVARNFLAAAHRIEQIEVELSLLAVADKASSRMKVARSAATVRSGAHRREASQSSTVEFENEFILPIDTKSCLDMKPQNEKVVIPFWDNDDESSNMTAHGCSRSSPLMPMKPLMWEAADKLDKTENHAIIDSHRRSLRRSYPVDAFTAGNKVTRCSPAVNSAPRPPPTWTVPFVLGGDGDGTASRSLRNLDQVDATTLQKTCPWTVPSPSYLDDSSYSSSGRPALLPSKSTAANYILPSTAEGEEISLDEEQHDRRPMGTVPVPMVATHPAADGYHTRPRSYSRSTQQPGAPQSAETETETAEVAIGSLWGREGTAASSSALKAHARYVGSHSLSDLGSVSRSSSTSVRSERSSNSILSMRRSSEEDSRPYESSLGVTVRLRTVHPQSTGTGNRSQGGVSIDSFEAFFEDEDDMEGEADFLVPVKAGQHFLSSSDPSRDAEVSLCVSVGSSRSPKSLSHSQGDSEGDDNMSAITWPDPTPKRTGRLEVQSGNTAELRYVSDRAAINNQRNHSLEEEEEEEDCSLEGDGFLHELDALSYFWAQRRKGIQSKATV